MMLVGVLFLQSACYSPLMLTTPQDFKNYSGKKSVWVMEVTKTNGVAVKYSRKFPGVLNDTAVIAKIMAEKSISKDQVDETIMNKDKVTKFNKDGKVYKVSSTTDSLLYYSQLEIQSVPINQVAEIQAIKYKRAPSIILTVGSISAVVAILELFINGLI